MKNDSPKKNFITNIREMTTMEKVCLGLESACYVLAVPHGIMTGLAVAGIIDSSAIMLGIKTGVVIISSQAFRVNKKIAKIQAETRRLNEETNELNERKKRR